MNLQEDGIEIIENFISQDIIDEIIHDVSTHHEDMPKHGIRNAEKKFHSIQSLINSDLLLDKATSYLGSPPNVVRVIFFDKTPEKNWLVTWHQDKTIAVNKQGKIPLWGPWSLKDGIHHVQPDISVLNKMVAFRIHLDDTNATNGCLKVIPKSHLLGIIKQHDIPNIIANHAAVSCNVNSGGLLIMRPHLLHASTKSTSPCHRRIVHVEYSNYPLPQGLQWA